MEALLAWIGASAPAAAMRSGAWLYPIVETVHIVGFVLLVGSVAMFDLRLLGLGLKPGLDPGLDRKVLLPALARHLLPWSAASLVLVVPSGLLLFATQPLELAANRAFLLKLALLGAAGINAALFHRFAYRRIDTRPLQARLHALASLLLWIGVIACGRLIAYL